VVDILLKTFAEALVAQGLPGVIIAGMGWWLWKQQQLLNTVQDRRVEDARKLAEAVHTLSSALDRNTETLRGLLEN